MLEKYYRSLNDQITTPPEVIARTLAAAAAPKPRPRRRRWAVLAAALGLCFILSTPVLAANVPAIYELMAYISPELAQHFTPVQRTCEDNGIRLEVVSAYIHGDTAEVYFTLQDLMGGRLDQDTHIDSFNISSGRDVSALGNCSLVGFDAQTQTATFLATLTNYDDQLFSGSKVTFTLNTFMSGKTLIADQPLPIDLTTLSEPTMQEVRWMGGGSRSKDIFEFPDDPTVLVPVMVPGENIYQPLPMLWMSGAAFGDGLLHIQSATIDPIQYNGQSYFYLIDREGNRLEADYGIYFSDKWGDPEGTLFSEDVFALPQSELGKYTLYGTFSADNARIDGDWQVTFTLEEAPAE